jgi:type II secretory pathway component PulF
MASAYSGSEFTSIVSDVQRQVDAGSTLSESLANYPAAFSPLLRGLVRAGEIGGDVEGALSRYSAI